MQARLFAIVMAIAIVIAVIDLIRRERMTFKYSFFWLATSSTILIFAVFDRVLFQLSELAGFVLPSNFVFFLLLTFFVFLSLFLTIYINEQNTRTESLAQSIAILEYKIKKTEKKEESPR